MRIHIIRLTAAILAASIMGCTTTQKFTVRGTPGTQIYDSQGTYLASVNELGNAEIKIKGKNYNSFLIAQEPGNGLKVPFALDYKNSSMAGSGLFLGSLGLTAAGAGLIAIGGEALIVAGACAGSLGLIGVIYGAGNWAFIQEPSDKYRYLKYQTTNNDMAFSRPDYADNPKGIADAYFNESPSPIEDNIPRNRTINTHTAIDTNSSANINNAADDTVTAQSSSRSIATDRSSRSINDYARQIEGNYVGPGSLSQKNSIVENYSHAVISIKRKDKNHVSVRVYDDNSDEFFDTPAIYTVTKEKDGTFSLTHSSIKTAKIKINKTGRMTYLHPRVKIEDSIYTLSIKGSQK